MSRLLVMACSATKADKFGAAIHVYQGPGFRIARPYWGRGGHVLIISAFHGILEPAVCIHPYDKKLTKDNGPEFDPLSLHNIYKHMDAGAHEDCLLFGGELYAKWFDQALDLAGCGDVQYRKTAGGIGEQLHELKEWCEQ